MSAMRVEQFSMMKPLHWAFSISQSDTMVVLVRSLSLGLRSSDLTAISLTRQHDEKKPIIYGPSKAMDWELEVGVIVGQGVPRLQGLDAKDADEHIFGFVILNDWSGQCFC